MKKKASSLYLLFAFILGIIFIVPSTQAQTYQNFISEMNDINTRARWKWGPFRLFPLLQFSNVGYDSNVYYSPEIEQPISDYTATLSLRVDLSFVFRNWLIFTFSENPSYVYFADQGDQRDLDNSYSFNLKMLAFSRLALSGTSQTNRAKIRWTGEIEAQTIQHNSETSGRIFFETPRNTYFGFTGQIRKIEYEDISGTPGSGFIGVPWNREERIGRGEFYYRVFSDSFFLLNAGYAEYAFDYPQSRFRNSFSYEANSGIRFPLLGRARGILSLGYKKLIPRTKSMRGYSGFVGNAALSFQFGRVNYRLEYTRDVPFSTFGNNIFYLGNRYGLGLSFYLNSFIKLEYSFRSGQNRYQEPTWIVLPTKERLEIKRHDRYELHSLAVVFRIIRNTGIGIEGNYWKRSSNYPNIDLNKFFVGSYLTYDF